MDFHKTWRMSVGERIKAERLSRKPVLERKELAALSGVPYPTLAGIENGDQASTTRLHAIAHALGVNPQWLETGAGPKYPGTARPEGSDWTDVRGYAQAVGLGKTVEGAEYEEAHKLKFRAESLRRKGLKANQLHVVYGAGDSMLPRIRPGDAIMFDTGDVKPKHGHLYVISLPGTRTKEYQVKRAMVLDDVIYFAADNPQGDHEWHLPRRMDTKRHPIEVIGRVRWIGSWED